MINLTKSMDRMHIYIDGFLVVLLTIILTIITFMLILWLIKGVN